jgi:hypothetical protein
MIGIYKITNKETAKCYVGLSIMIDDRINNHKAALRAGIHKNQELQNDWIQFGEDGFYFDVMDIIDVDDYSRGNLNKIETEYIHHFKENTYNIAKVKNKLKIKTKPTPKPVAPLTPPKSLPSAMEMRFAHSLKKQKELYKDADYIGTLNLKESERKLIIKAAVKCNFKRKNMSLELGYSERTIYRKIHQHGLAGII